MENEELKKEENLSKCSVCQEIKPRICIGKYPDGRNKKYSDDKGGLYVGRKCPDCVRSNMKSRMQATRKKD
jgi:hypothetical protein